MKLSRRVIRVVDKTTFSRTNVFFCANRKVIARVITGINYIIQYATRKLIGRNDSDFLCLAIMA